MQVCVSIFWIVPTLLFASPPEPAADQVGPLVQCLWLVQRYGNTAAVDLRSDQKVKGRLGKALGKQGILTDASGLIEPAVFARLAGTDGRLDPLEAHNALERDMPDSRKRLLPRVRAHADLLTTSFDMIDEPHRQAAEKLVEWIVKNHRPGEALDITVICTGNSRRSILGATMGNIAAAYYGLPEIRFHSGGTAPTAFNQRTIATLREIGVEIDPTGTEAPRGEPVTANPTYVVRWGRPGTPALEATEFSKHYFDSGNPHTGFVALMVCGEADAACPVVKGAALRVSMPYLDPKLFDDSNYESTKYAERRDDMGRLLLGMMMQVRNRIGQASSAP
jgi:hypothetical protein